MYTVYHYPTCSTCKKAIKWLKDNEVSFELKHIVEKTPSQTTLETLYKKSQLPLKKFFNTSGKVYREKGIKDALKTMTETEQLELLASNGMLLKRPIITDGETVLVGFKEEEWAQAVLK